MKILALDIGGTGMQYCSLDLKTSEKTSEVESISTREIDKNELLKFIGDLVNKLKPDILSVSSPGGIINKTYVSGFSGIKGYGEFDFKKELLPHLENKQIIISLLNDANAALLSEINEENKNLDIVLLSIGTGIGGAIAFNGKIRAGNRGFAGEFGYQIVNDKEQVSPASSSRAIETKYKKEFNEEKSAKEIMDEYDSSEKSKKIIDMIVKQNAINIFNIYYGLDIDLFILSGGITNSKKFVDMIIKKVDELTKTRGAGNKIEIKIAKEKNSASLKGAIIQGIIESTEMSH
ncbi:MAG: ROK family protein [Mycoplasmatales bacterium]|nr:ROK family protein [Mycoplasmatales bacterium]